MEYSDFLREFVKSGDLVSLLIVAGISLRSHYKAHRNLFLPLDLRHWSVVCHSREDVVDVCCKTWEYNFCLRVAETAVELDHLRSLRSLHEAAVKHSGERTSFCNHCSGSRLHYFFKRELKVFVSDDRNR